MKTNNRILCVEDHPDTCELVSVILKDYKLVSVKGIGEALIRAKKEKFSLYLLDYHLPDGTGFDLCLSIREFDFKTPVLFFTGTSSMTEKQAFEIGAQGLLKKSHPFLPEALNKKVSELVGG